MVNAKFVAVLKKITFRLRYALGMRQLLSSVPFLCVLTPDRGIRNASWGKGDSLLVSHDVFVIVYFLLCLRSSSIDHTLEVVSLDKDSNYLSCC